MSGPTKALWSAVKDSIGNISEINILVQNWQWQKKPRFKVS